MVRQLITDYRFPIILLSKMSQAVDVILDYRSAKTRSPQSKIDEKTRMHLFRSGSLGTFYSLYFHDIGVHLSFTFSTWLEIPTQITVMKYSIPANKSLRFFKSKICYLS